MDNEIIDDDEDELRQHYVYELRDPSNNLPFYVGKGTGSRIDHHELEALRSLDLETRKLSKIREIKARKEDVVARVIARFNTAAEAFAVEAVLIHWIYGFAGDNNDSLLTNIQAGHGAEFIRKRGNLLELPGIDIKKEKAYDGSYTLELIELNRQQGIEAELNNLRLFFLTTHPDWATSVVDMSKPADPSLFIYFGSIARIQCLLRPRSRTLVINIRPFKETREEQDSFKATCELLGERTHGLKNFPQGSYFKMKGLDGRFRITDKAEILRSVEDVWQMLLTAEISTPPVIL